MNLFSHTFPAPAAAAEGGGDEGEEEEEEEEEITQGRPQGGRGR
eukprot:gene26445-34032_t